MSIDEKKEFKLVVSIVAVVILVVLVSLMCKFNLYDLIYLFICLSFLFRYIKSLKNNKKIPD